MRLTGYIIAGAMAITWGTAPAQTIDDARQMMLDGDYAAALPIFEKALSAKPKDASLNQWVGVCLLRSGWGWINVYAALIGAILLGRGIEGLLHAFLLRPGAYSWWIWAQESFVIPLPGLIIQLAVLPVAVLALWKLHPVLGPYGEH